MTFRIVVRDCKVLSVRMQARSVSQPPLAYTHESCAKVLSAVSLGRLGGGSFDPGRCF